MIFIGELGGHRHGPLWGPQPIPAGIIPNLFGILSDSVSSFSEIIKSVSLYLQVWHELKPPKSEIFIGDLQFSVIHARNLDTHKTGLHRH